jgi:hypothetical protein
LLSCVCPTARPRKSRIPKNELSFEASGEVTREENGEESESAFSLHT